MRGEKCLLKPYCITVALLSKKIKELRFRNPFSINGGRNWDRTSDPYRVNDDVGVHAISPILTNPFICNAYRVSNY